MTDDVIQKDLVKYELMVIVDPDLGSAGIKKRLDAVRKLISEVKGKIFFEDLLGDRDLAYTIKKKDRGYYAVLDFEGDDVNLEELDNVLKLDNEIIRHMVLRLPFAFEAKSFAQIEEEMKKLKKEEKNEEESTKKTKKVEKPAPAPKKAEKEEIKEVKEEKKEEPVEEPEETKPEEEKEKKTATLEEVDKKLKNIIDNPDLNF